MNQRLRLRSSTDIYIPVALHIAHSFAGTWNSIEHRSLAALFGIDNLQFGRV